MNRFLTLVMAVAVVFSVNAKKFSYDFHNIPISQALLTLSRDHRDVNLSFIYQELENYNISTSVNTDNTYDALRLIIGLNPVSLIEKNGVFYIEALQHGKYVYTGWTVGSDGQPVVAATVMILAPKDSTVITYGITDDAGRFTIPCDRRKVLAKLSCLGYKTTYRRLDTFNVGTVIMPEHVVLLGQVTVKADNAQMYADRTTYIPTQRQKNASQTGDELLSHMAIPQLGMITNGNVTTNSGRKIAVYIDYLPASENDLKAMLVKDVKKVEYYTSPSDPRFQGNEYVVNFIMQQYEYGGYVKGFGHLNLISYSEQLLASSRFQYKKMKYDLIASGWNMNSSHYGSDVTETFKLPDENRRAKEFNRFSSTTKSKTENRQYFVGFKTTYTSDKILASAEIDGSVDNKPHDDTEGTVCYSNNAYPSSTYASTHDEKSRFLSFNGYYYFELTGKDALTFTPVYMYSHTEQKSSYLENHFSGIYNSAIDNTNQLRANLSFSHNLRHFGYVVAFIRGSYEYNRTSYSGSVSSLDKAKSVRIGSGVSYSIHRDNFYGMAGVGYDWDQLKFGEIEDKTASPWADFSLQFLLKKKHSLSMTFHYSTWQPSSSYKSDNIIVSSPFLKYTGNPKLFPYKSYDIGFDYTWIPNNRFNLAAFAYGWFVDDRYTFDYVPSADGILRTIKQPIGNFANIKYGVSATAKFLDSNLDLTGQIARIQNHDGKPFNQNNSVIYWHARIRYYLKKWNFSLTYISDGANTEGSTSGFWNKRKSDWQLSIGWANGDWNIKTNIINMTRWHWRSNLREMQSPFYCINEQLYNGSSHALIQISATYTFGYGKKVQNDNEPSVSGSASSGILK